MADATSLATVKVLSLELKALQKEPVEGFQVSLPDDSNFFEWNIIVFGAPKTLYEGGYFKVGIYSLAFLKGMRFVFIISNTQKCYHLLKFRPTCPFQITIPTLLRPSDFVHECGILTFMR